MKRFLERVGRERDLDLESLEFGLWQAVLSAGARLLESLLAGVGSGRREQALSCDCGGRMQSAGRKSKRIKTVLGDVDFQRSLYVCETCGQGRFPGDHILVVDLYHARQHLHTLVKILVPDSGTEQNRLWRGWRKLLDKGRVDSILLSAQRQLPSGEEQRSAAEKEIGYFRNNAGRMRYGHFRSQGFFVGSGVVEAGCKTVVGQRLKQSGMEWTVKGANAIIALRCCHLSNRMAEFWEQRAA